MTEIKTIMIQKEWHLIGKVYGKKGEEGGGRGWGVDQKRQFSVVCSTGKCTGSNINLE